MMHEEVDSPEVGKTDYRFEAKINQNSEIIPLFLDYSNFYFVKRS